MPKCECQHDSHFESGTEAHPYMAERRFILVFFDPLWMNQGQSMRKCFECLANHTVHGSDLEVMAVMR